jgi:16S rRNA (cytidine1402-2'-O)-methyltransferase
LKRDISREAAGSGTPRETSRDAVMEPGLYVVATPIGNLGDITRRALEVLAHVAFIAAEDTRVTRALLHHYGIGAKLVAVHEHNEARAAQSVVDAIAAGNAVALVSDAGTPAVSDPGHTVVQRVREAGHRVIPVPGASALTAAISASGLAFEGIVFAGFLPAKGAARRERLQALAAGPWAIALFESPHRIAQTLGDLHAALGERDIVIAREITKKFETIARVPLAAAREWIEADPDRMRGEFVLVIEGRPVEASRSVDAHAVLGTLLEELPVKQAVALAVRITGAPRNELYAAALERKR